MKVDIYITILIIIALSSFLLGIRGENCNPGYGDSVIYHLVAADECTTNGHEHIKSESECNQASVALSLNDNLYEDICWYGIYLFMGMGHAGVHEHIFAVVYCRA